jgi:NAD(P)-dependent dehydrogenase (short-subunit alcohol dehydrogenase family)
MTGPATTDPISLFDVAGHSIVVTGASGALGHAVGVALVAMGARVTLVAGNAEALEAAAVEARAGRGEVTAFVRRPDSLENVDAILEAAIAAYGTVDAIFVASGYNEPDAIETMTLEQWERVMDANVKSPWMIAKAFGTHVAARGGRGKMVLISSVRGRFGSPAGYTAYSTSKGATDSLTRTLASEWGQRGINVNAIAPTVFRSKLTEWIYADTEAGLASRTRNLSRIPMKRLGEPEDFIGAAVYLLSAASDFVTGQILYVDGGYSAS